MAGKGDKPRKVDKKKYDENYDRIFGRTCLECGSRDLTKCSITGSELGPYGETERYVCNECGYEFPPE